ncbi:DUF11 domain-containing protein [Companilactobacillus kimchiensis]|nr:DUF11 domain-containing protein [Companilactobacillus kimchiensis]
MKYNEYISRTLFIFFMSLLLIFTFGNHPTTVKAVSQNDLQNAATTMGKYDGINNWTLQPNRPGNAVGNIRIGGNISLGYAFGTARDSNNNVITGGDTTITDPSTKATVNGSPTINNSKINIFLNNNKKYYGILHQGKNSYLNGDPGTTSDTSIDFALLTGSSEANFSSAMNVLTNLNTIAGSKADKLFYTGTDDNGHPAYKLVGSYTKLGGIYVEIVLRAAPNGAPIVQRELFVYNSSAAKRQFQTFYGEDTALSPDMDTNVDNVPMYAIGGGQGLYLLSGATYNPASKLYVTNNTAYGFNDFMGRIFSNPSSWSIKGKVNQANGSNMTSPTLPWSANPTSSQDGDTNAAADSNLLVGTLPSGTSYKVVDGNGLQDTAYTLRWNQTSLPSQGVQGFASNIGATIANYALPNIKKTYTNLTTTNGTNNVGDTLQFTLSAQDDGYKSHWDISRILDELPTGLTLDPNSITSASVKGNNIDFDPGDYISSQTSPTVHGRKYSTSFKATINNQAPYNLANGNLTNTVKFTGHNKDQTEDQTYSDSVKIPVVTPKFNTHFKKQVLNYTDNPTGVFKNEVTAKKGDTIKYQVTFISDGSAHLNSADFSDTLPIGLELVPGSVTLNGVAKPSLNFSTGALNNNTTNTVDFTATVTGVTKTTASNTAYLKNVKSSDGKTTASIPSEEPADVDIQETLPTTDFKEVPTSIDFGSVNTAGIEKIIPNVKTNGELSIDHSNNTPFQVRVSYDNNDSDKAISNGDTKLIQDNDSAMFLSQNNGDSTDTWKVLSTEPTPIKSDGFSGVYNDYSLTKYIGPKKWRLRIPAGAKSGQYHGVVTWAIEDTPQS